MTNAEYHARPEISKSDLDLLAKSPRHLDMKKKGELPPSDTPSLLLGSVFHKLILEPNDFENEFAIEPTADKRTKDGKATWSEWETTLNARTPVPRAIYETAQKMSEQFAEFKGYAFLKDGKAEQSYFGELEGVKVKCRPDFFNEKLGLLIDLKSTADASPSAFAKSVANYNYHVQAAFYSDIMRQNGFEVNAFMFIAVEKTAPYFVGFYDLDPVSVDKGREDYARLLNLWRECCEKSEFYGYGKIENGEYKAVQTLSLPAWKFYE